MSVFDVLQERGFIAQVSHEEEIRELLEKEKITFYIGFDPTADSLHVGHFIALMAMAHMQRAGHRPIALLGGGTGMIGDPSGKDDMRKMLTPEFINHNIECFKKQMSKFIDFSDGKALMVNNGDWLLSLNYVNMLREVGTHFTVNHMLAAECYKKRWDKGLTFFEFNYMIMQAYDFYKLHKDYNCIMEMGGDDQWSNMLAGVELIRRKDQKPAFCMTCKLLTTSDGRKMGKTEKGALWLDPEKCSPYDFYQYWRNVDDADVEKCLALLTFLPMDEVRRLGAYKDEKINEAKKVLAYEVTKLIHGQEEADKAVKATEALFGGGADLEHVPTLEITEADKTAKLVDLLTAQKVFSSKREARQMIAQRGLYLNNEVVEDAELALTPELFAEDGGVLIRKGKKKYFRIVVK
ncbi:MAG: tyrosine--tRNA ligase [Acidaminococcaceae bacterium]|nr:tyrosine--tRNA ligase [Acidaminococcaceae bacterium]MBO6265101.1 tyrosine--tRNA ligase [Acidaminococcaceae bacterium]MBP3264168.1 tyrosine--tRNA ligase [Acidaminococcaceae bacterium]MBQ5343708.1 tyrosine--tRNA ligase [Acidaminococcaceae bacterium]MBQ8492444.1 tyrosine--tRNA ligase [Acidaminococcaceae bacterium]